MLGLLSLRPILWGRVHGEEGASSVRRSVIAASLSILSSFVQAPRSYTVTGFSILKQLPSWGFPWYSCGPITPTTAELLLEFEDHWTGTRRFLLGFFPIIFPSYLSDRGSLLEIYCSLRYWVELVPTLMAEEKFPSLMLLTPAWMSVSTPMAGRIQGCWLCPGSSHNPLCFSCLTCRNPLSLMWSSWSWGSQASVTGRQGLARPSLQQKSSVTCRITRWNFRDACKEYCCTQLPTPLNVRRHAWFFQVCGPIKVRLFSLMVRDGEHNECVLHEHIPDRKVRLLLRSLEPPTSLTATAISGL